ncbi:MAG: protein-glutamate O-methyltransferase CheR [Spirochaetaceae bacterium]|nr:protein-glutamate O-methyltransferase CheR [Spirochaetaceae bacterium]
MAVLSEYFYDKFRTLIYNNSGIHFSDSNRTILESRLAERLKLKDNATIEDYYLLVSSDDNELRTLLDAVTTNLTKFFRNIPQYETFQHYVIPHLVAHKKEKGLNSIKLWSAGCSTGEEAYTNAMCLKEWLPANFNFTVTASDLSLKSLLTAERGFYPKERCADIADNLLEKYFIADDKGYTVKNELKNHIKFDYHNLNYESGVKNFDIVFCRNVLIYFDEKAQKQVVERFYRSMADYSYLFIGHSESLFGLDTKFKFIKTDWSCIYGKFTN